MSGKIFNEQKAKNKAGGRWAEIGRLIYNIFGEKEAFQKEKILKASKKA